MNLTDNEKAILRGACESEYEGFDTFDFEVSNGTWVLSAIEHSELDPKVARGAISSLIKKGLVEIDDSDKEVDPSIHASKECIKICEGLDFIIE